VRRYSFVGNIVTWVFHEVACFFDEGDRHRRVSMQCSQLQEFRE
jgi:hypothetical protein